MARAKKSKAKKSKAKKSTVKKSKAVKTKKTARKATKARAPARKSKKAPARKAAAKPAPRKAKKAVTKKKQIVGEGDYAASKKFLKEQAGFVERNKAKIPAMGKAAEAALDGPEGDSLRQAEKDATSHSMPE